MVSDPATPLGGGGEPHPGGGRPGGGVGPAGGGGGSVGLGLGEGRPGSGCHPGGAMSVCLSRHLQKTKFTFLRCAILLEWEFRKELFSKLAWGQGLGAEYDIFICMVRGGAGRWTQAVCHRGPRGISSPPAASEGQPRWGWGGVGIPSLTSASAPWVLMECPLRASGGSHGLSAVGSGSPSWALWETTPPCAWTGGAVLGSCPHRPPSLPRLQVESNFTSYHQFLMQASSYLSCPDKNLKLMAMKFIGRCQPSGLALPTTVPIKPTWDRQTSVPWGVLQQGQWAGPRAATSSLLRRGDTAGLLPRTLLLPEEGRRENPQET